jgi:phosphoribulokinase
MASVGEVIQRVFNSSNNTFDVSQKGSIKENVINQQEIRDTSFHKFGPFDVSEFKNYFIEYNSTHDVGLRIQIRDGDDKIKKYWNGTEFDYTSTPYSNLPGTGTDWIALQDKLDISKYENTKIRIWIGFLTTPTTGSISINIIGRYK